MSDYKIIKEESEVMVDNLITMIRVLITGKNRYINLNFDSALVSDHFYNKSSANIGHREKVKERVIEILLNEQIQKENLLNVLIKKALECPEVKKEIDNRKIGQYKVKPEDFLNYDFRKNSG
jgi:hypothetical protein